MRLRRRAGLRSSPRPASLRICLSSVRFATAGQQHGAGQIPHRLAHWRPWRMLTGRLVVAGEKVDDGDVARLPVAVATADPLLDPLRVPRQVVVDDGVAELQVQPFRPRFRRDQGRGPLPELVDERQAHGHRRARRPRALAVGVAPRVEGCWTEGVFGMARRWRNIDASQTASYKRIWAPGVCLERPGPLLGPKSPKGLIQTLLDLSPRTAFGRWGNQIAPNS